MVKIYECGFTTSDYGQEDTIGGVTMTLTAQCTHLDVLPNFEVRPGWNVKNATTVPTDNNNILYFYDTSRTRKSFVLWIRHSSGAASATYDLFSGGTAFVKTGIQLYNGGVRFMANGTQYTTLLSAGIYGLNEWHMFVVEIDRSAGNTKFYVDGAYKTTYGNVPPSSPTMSFAGDSISSEEVGLIQVYDTLLTTAEVADLWNTGLIDAPSQQPLLTLSGYVFDLDEYTVSGADVRVFNHGTSRLESVTTTTSSGTYVAYFDKAGEYSLAVSKPLLPGGIAVPVTVTSGGYTVYDS